MCWKYHPRVTHRTTDDQRVFGHHALLWQFWRYVGKDWAALNKKNSLWHWWYCKSSEDDGCVLPLIFSFPSFDSHAAIQCQWLRIFLFFHHHHITFFAAAAAFIPKLLLEFIETSINNSCLYFYESDTLSIPSTPVYTFVVMNRTAKEEIFWICFIIFT